MFDFDATLPLMAVQFLLLMVALNAVFYKPLMKSWTIEMGTSGLPKQALKSGWQTPRTWQNSMRRS